MGWIWLVGLGAAWACGGSTEQSGASGGSGGGPDGGGGAGTGASGGTGAVGAFGGVAGAGALGGVAGTGAFGGVAGAGAFGGLPSTGGTSGTCYPFQTPSPACGSSCGNNLREDCSSCPDAGPGFGGNGGFGGMPCQSKGEACDGADLAAQTCASLGYSGGKLGCTSWCMFDSSGCDRCMPKAGHLAACDQDAVLAKYPSTLALAATDQEIGVAWISQDGGQPEAWFARLAPDLSLISKTGPFAPTCPQSVALAARPGGWVLATGWYTGVVVHALDATGKLSATTFASNTGSMPSLGQRSADGPLLIWNEGKALGVALVSADGATVTPKPKIVLPQEIVTEVPPAVAFVGDGFLVAIRSGSRVVVARVEADGSWTGGIKQPAPESTEYASLAASGGDARLTYSNFGSPTIGVELVHLDKSGDATSPPSWWALRRITSTRRSPSRSARTRRWSWAATPAVRTSRPSSTCAGWTPLVRSCWGPEKIAADPSWITQYRAVGRGADVIVGFLSGTSWSSSNAGAAFPIGIGLARIQP